MNSNYCQSFAITKFFIKLVVTHSYLTEVLWPLYKDICNSREVTRHDTDHSTQGKAQEAVLSSFSQKELMVRQVIRQGSLTQ